MTPEVHELTHEIGGDDSVERFSAEHTQAVEHSQYARSKKVIMGPLFVPKHAVDDRTMDPVQGALTASSVSLAMAKNKAYRLVASRAAFYRLSKGASTAVSGDIYLPANTPTVVLSGALYDTLSAIKAEASDTNGIVQIVEVK